MSELTPRTLKRLLQKMIDVMIIRHVASWEADQAELARLRERVEKQQAVVDVARLTEIVEDWLHNHLDADYRPLSKGTMRWQWCQRPGHPEDDDCACCMEHYPFTWGEMELERCGCICHDRVDSLVKHLVAALDQLG